MPTMTDKKFGIFTPLTQPTSFRADNLRSGHRVKKPKRIARNREELNALLDASDCYRNNLKTLSKVKTVRFLLTEDDRMVWGPEGGPYPENDVPGHAHLAETEDLWEAKCITAGNAFFSEDNQLVGFSNQSGDFRPSFDSLQFALPHFINLSIPMADQILIKKVNCCGGFESYHHLDNPVVKVKPKEISSNSVSDVNKKDDTNHAKMHSETSVGKQYISGVPIFLNALLVISLLLSLTSLIALCVVAFTGGVGAIPCLIAFTAGLGLFMPTFCFIQSVPQTISDDAFEESIFNQTIYVRIQANY